MIIKKSKHYKKSNKKIKNNYSKKHKNINKKFF